MIQAFDFLRELPSGKVHQVDTEVVEESPLFLGEMYSEDHLLEVERTAYERGVLEGRETASTEFQTSIAQAGQERDENIRRRIESWTETAQSKIEQRIDERLLAAEDRLATTIVDVLRPFLQTQCERKAVADLKQLLNVHLGWSEHKTAVVSVPEHLMTFVKEELGGALQGSEFIPSPDVEISIEFADTVLRTQLANWLRNLFSE